MCFLGGWGRPDTENLTQQGLPGLQAPSALQLFKGVPRCFLPAPHLSALAVSWGGVLASVAWMIEQKGLKSLAGNLSWDAHERTGRERLQETPAVAWASEPRAKAAPKLFWKRRCHEEKQDPRACFLP